jgi:mono/diheme cytochrome c family protein
VRFLVLIVLFSPVLAWAGESEDRMQEGKQLFEAHCIVCHSLELPRSQQLDRATWEWVMSDMVNEFGATWLTEEQQKLIVDYLVVNHGPPK